MPRTVDRFPGEREDEGLILEDQGPAGLNGGDPATAGGLRYVTDRFRFMDALGVFNGRPAYVSPSSNPTATDDDDAGFSPGMIWVNATTGGVYICLDNTVSAAVWASPAVFSATEVGQHLVSLDGSTFERVQPVVSPDDGWLSNGDGELLIEGLLP